MANWRFDSYISLIPFHHLSIRAAWCMQELRRSRSNAKDYLCTTIAVFPILVPLSSIWIKFRNTSCSRAWMILTLTLMSLSAFWKTFLPWSISFPSTHGREVSLSHRQTIGSIASQESSKTAVFLLQYGGHEGEISWRRAVSSRRNPFELQSLCRRPPNNARIKSDDIGKVKGSPPCWQY